MRLALFVQKEKPGAGFAESYSGLNQNSDTWAEFVTYAGFQCHQASPEFIAAYFQPDMSNWVKPQRISGFSL
jgi:hypothetical protein